MSADEVLLYARSEWRRRWRAHVILAAVTAATVAVAVAALTGAGRSETAFDRLRAATNASDAVVASPAIEEDPAAAIAAADSIRQLDGVIGAAAHAVLFVRPEGSDYFPNFTLLATAPLVAEPPGGVDTPIVIAGRAPDPERADEVAVSSQLADDHGISVGDTVRLESATAAWVDAVEGGGDAGPPDGPRVDVRVVGVARSPADFGRWNAVVHLTPAFVIRYGTELDVRSGVHIQLTDAMLRAAQDGRLPGLGDVEVLPSQFQDDEATDDGLSTIATAMRLVAFTAAAAGAVTVALALGRLTRLVLQDWFVLRTLGWTRGRLSLALLVVFAPWLAVGIALGVVGGIAGSPLAIVGLARDVDPEFGALPVDAAVVLGTVAVAAVVGLACVALCSWRGLVSTPAQGSPTRAPRVALLRPLPVALGVRHAFFGAADRGGRSSRGALGALLIGMVGAVAALGVSASIARLGADPTLTGQGTERLVSSESFDDYERAIARLEADERVAVLAGLHLAFEISTPGGTVAMVATEAKRGDLGVAVVRGRVAQQADEVALGPLTIERLDTDVGDVVELGGPHGSAEFRIVGAVLFPEGDFRHDDGVAMTTGGAERIVGQVRDGIDIHEVVFEWTEGVDPATADAELAADGFTVFTNDSGLAPATVTNLGEVESLPRWLAAFVGVLSLMTLAHAVTISVRLRTREFGALRAIGFTPGASTGVVAAHAVTLVAVATVVGVPLGLVAGRQVWTVIAERAHVVVRAVAPWSAIGALVVAMLAGASALTAVPAWRARRLRPADALRAE